jgi:hypothetical protein
MGNESGERLDMRRAGGNQDPDQKRYRVRFRVCCYSLVAGG